MYYELYVDVLFLVNFFMDYILLLFVWRVLHCNVRHWNIAVGASLGAALTCIIIILPIPNALIEFVMFHLLVNTCMVRVGLKIKSTSNYLKSLILLYIGAFFMGGILESIQQYIKVGGLFLIFAIVGYYLALGMWQFLSKLQRWNAKYVQVELFLGEKKVEIRGLLDTGNCLYDSFTGKPVSVVTKDVVKLLVEEEKTRIRYIPYQSIGKKNGVIQIICIDKLCVHGAEIHCFEKPLIGIAEEKFSEKGDFQMILNPNLF